MLFLDGFARSERKRPHRAPVKSAEKGNVQFSFGVPTRQLKGRLRSGSLRQLLITGPGGQGKTALAGKLAQDLQRRGYEVFAWAARPENSWKDFNGFLFGILIRLHSSPKVHKKDPFLALERVFSLFAILRTRYTDLC